MELLKLYEISFLIFFFLSCIRKRSTSDAILKHLCGKRVNIDIKDQAKYIWTAVILLKKSSLTFFKLVPTSTPLSPLFSNKIFATLKWVCREIGNN